MIERVTWLRALSLALCFTSMAAGALPAAWAEQPGVSETRRDHDHDRAQRARDRGEIRPLEEIMPIIARFPGEVARIELEHDRDGWIYEFKIIDPAGRLVEIKVDAATGRVIKVEGE